MSIERTSLPDTPRFRFTHFPKLRHELERPTHIPILRTMNSIAHLLPLKGDDRCKIFLSNLDGRINTEDLHRFFERFGKIEYIESWSPKSAIILYYDQQSVDRVLGKYRTCTINHQEIYVRRIRYGIIDRFYQDSPILMISPSNDADLHSIQWTAETIRRSFSDYDKDIEKIHLASSTFHAWIYFRDYDCVDRVLLQWSVFRVDGVTVDLKRAKIEVNHRYGSERLIQTNQILKRQMKRKWRGNLSLSIIGTLL